MSVFRFDPALAAPPPLTGDELAAARERVAAAVARDTANPPASKPPSQLRTYDPAKVRVTFCGVECIPLILCGASFRYSPRRERRQRMRAARRARKLRRGWA